jgi:hypothetical protein
MVVFAQPGEITISLTCPMPPALVGNAAALTGDETSKPPFVTKLVEARLGFTSAKIPIIPKVAALFIMDLGKLWAL